ncbi:6-bladed beta-propeller [Candidatus Palauibacter sp.]|uniref:6-bladed beta-propeller n=1 Tax=Candidatus Palauibacter sp. TaxID=3101350 RepID=UPI003B029C5B
MLRSPLSAVRATLAPVFLSAAACGGDGGTATRGLDSPDVTISPAVDTVYTVGVLDGEQWEMFGRIAAVAFDVDGSLFILDNDAGHVVVIDPAGAFVRTISNKGEGPGELRFPSSLIMFRDGRVGVRDFGNQGIVLFNREGDFLETFRIERDGPTPAGQLRAMPDHSLIAASSRVSFSPEGEMEREEGRPITRFRLDGIHDLFHEAWPGLPIEARVDEAEAENVRIQVEAGEAFPLPLSVGVLRDGRVAIADSIGYRVKLLDPAGAVLSTLERPVPPVTVTPAIEEAERERRLASLESGGGGGGGGIMTLSITGTAGARGGGNPMDSEGMRDAMRRMREDQIRDLRFPEEMPVIRNLAVDWSDRIWVQRSALPGETGLIDILSAEGQYFGSLAADGLRIPGAFGPGGLLAYVERDELDIQRVRVVRLVGDELLESGETG